MAHPFGTDNFGRDVLSRVIHGARVDLEMGIMGVIWPFLLGTLLGSLAGYFGGVVDMLIMRLVDITLAFPFLVLMIAIIAVLGPGLTSFYIAMALVGWVSYARLVRAQILVLKGSEFILAARNLGYGPLRIIFRHMLPNALVPSIVFSMSDVVLVILAGSSISYLGLGVQPPTAEWGVMIAEGQNFMTTAWWITAFPGLRHRLPGARLQPARGRPRREARHPGMSAPLLEVEGLTVEFATPRWHGARGRRRVLRARPRRGAGPGRRERLAARRSPAAR